jgi:transcriptional regulator with XRE-family HTH domain
MGIYDRIVELCTKNNISLAKLEKENGLSNGIISKWKTSSPKTDATMKIARYFNVSLDYVCDMGNFNKDNEIEYNPFRKLIVEYRKKRGMSQKKLSDAISVTRTIISEFEKGNTNLPEETYMKIFEILDITTEAMKLSKDVITLSGEQQRIKEKIKIDKDIDEIESIVQELHGNPDLRLLLNIGRKAHPNDLKKIIKIGNFMIEESSQEAESNGKVRGKNVAGIKEMVS